MRVLAMFAAVVLAVVACDGQPRPSTSVTSVPSTSSAELNPARIDRVRADLPGGYEVADVAGKTTPVALWGFGPDWTADPPACGVLADPVVEVETTRGWSGSGPGGIVYAVVARSPQSVPMDPAVLAECGQWTVSGGRTSGSVTLTAGPAIDAATTIALSTASTTVVEGGTETHSHAETVTADLDGYVAFVSVVTDPGSSNPQLGQDFAATLLVKTVAQLRG